MHLHVFVLRCAHDSAGQDAVEFRSGAGGAKGDRRRRRSYELSGTCSLPASRTASVAIRAPNDDSMIGIGRLLMWFEVKG